MGVWMVKSGVCGEESCWMLGQGASLTTSFGLTSTMDPLV